MLQGLRRPTCLVRASRSLRPQSLVDAVGRRLDSTSASSDPGKVIFSGIQPTGSVHLGNYLGAISQWVDLQKTKSDKDKLIFSIVDLHSLTARFSTAAERYAHREQTLATLLAAGLDPQQCRIFYQSDVPEHSELHWILSCQAGIGALARMPTFKEKIDQSRPAQAGSSSSRGSSGDEELGALLLGGKDDEEGLKLGLLSYPVLQAADILLYGTTHVPVGEDQLVHIEFARRAARAFNHRDASSSERPLFNVPEAIVGPARRVMSLTEPTKKMSKSSRDHKSCIFLQDDEDSIRSKVRSALTDSIDSITYDPITRPGVANLLNIVALLESKIHDEEISPQDVAKEHDAMNVEGSIMRVLKERTADVVNRELQPVREAYLALVHDKERLNAVAHMGKLKALSHAGHTMKRVKRSIGLIER